MFTKEQKHTKDKNKRYKRRKILLTERSRHKKSCAARKMRQKDMEKTTVRKLFSHYHFYKRKSGAKHKRKTPKKAGAIPRKTPKKRALCCISIQQFLFPKGGFAAFFMEGADIDKGQKPYYNDTRMQRELQKEAERKDTSFDLYT